MAVEKGRATTAYVSGYQRDRVHRSRLVRGERRELVANFNGVIPEGRIIASATWRTNQAYAANLSGARIDGRQVFATLTAQQGTRAHIKCEVTLDSGDVYNQVFIVSIKTGPWFNGEQSPPAGPNELTVTA